MKNINNIIWGFVLIILGIIFGLNALEITNINIFFDGWWTFIIIIFSLVSLFTEEDKLTPFIGLIIGIVLYLSCIDLISMATILKLLPPLVLVLIGFSLLIKDIYPNTNKQPVKKLNSKTAKEYMALFGGKDLIFTESFDGCSLTAIFAGLNCRIKDVAITSDNVINATAIFGGMTIYVPTNVNVVIYSTSIFGGVSDKRVIKEKDAKNTIYINATSMFGGIDVK